jgi:hypothetical protein
MGESRVFRNAGNNVPKRSGLITPIVAWTVWLECHMSVKLLPFTTTAFATFVGERTFD